MPPQPYGDRCRAFALLESELCAGRAERRPVCRGDGSPRSTMPGWPHPPLLISGIAVGGIWGRMSLDRFIASRIHGSGTRAGDGPRAREGNDCLLWADVVVPRCGVRAGCSNGVVRNGVVREITLPKRVCEGGRRTLLTGKKCGGGFLCRFRRQEHVVWRPAAGVGDCSPARTSVLLANDQSNAQWPPKCAYSTLGVPQQFCSMLRPDYHRFGVAIVCPQRAVVGLR